MEFVYIMGALVVQIRKILSIKLLRLQIWKQIVTTANLCRPLSPASVTQHSIQFYFVECILLFELLLLYAQYIEVNNPSIGNVLLNMSNILSIMLANVVWKSWWKQVAVHLHLHHLSKGVRMKRKAWH